MKEVTKVQEFRNTILHKISAKASEKSLGVFFLCVDFKTLEISATGNFDMQVTIEILENWIKQEKEKINAIEKGNVKENSQYKH